MKKPAQIVLFRILGFIIFLIFLALANVAIPYVNIALFTGIVMFFNANIILLLIMTGTGMINEIFWNFRFPFNIVAPITGGALAVVILMFLYNVWFFLKGILHVDAAIPIEMLYVLLFLLVMVIGYIIILSERDMHEKREMHEEKKGEHKRKEKEMTRKHDKVEWEDVESEFRTVFYNIGHGINKMFEGNKKKAKRKRRRK